MAAGVVEKRGWRRGQTDVSTVLLLEAAKAIDVKILLFRRKLDALISVIGNLWLSEVDKAELVF